MNWISVKERLPKLGEEVLILRGKFIEIGNLSKELDVNADPEWFNRDGHWDLGVTHWMPLPIPEGDLS